MTDQSYTTLRDIPLVSDASTEAPRATWASNDGSLDLSITRDPYEAFVAMPLQSEGVEAVEIGPVQWHMQHTYRLPSQDTEAREAALDLLDLSQLDFSDISLDAFPTEAQVMQQVQQMSSNEDASQPVAQQVFYQTTELSPLEYPRENMGADRHFPNLQFPNRQFLNQPVPQPHTGIAFQPVDQHRFGHQQMQNPPSVGPPSDAQIPLVVPTVAPQGFLGGVYPAQQQTLPYQPYPQVYSQQGVKGQTEAPANAYIHPQGVVQPSSTESSAEPSSTAAPQRRRRTSNRSRRPPEVPRHRCPACDSRFLRPSALRAHQTVHTGALPYPCPFPDCPRHQVGHWFSVRSNMMRHVQLAAQHRGHEPPPYPAGFVMQRDLTWPEGYVPRPGEIVVAR